MTKRTPDLEQVEVRLSDIYSHQGELYHIPTLERLRREGKLSGDGMAAYMAWRAEQCPYTHTLDA